MTKTDAASSRFWQSLSADTSMSLSKDQKAEIDRALTNVRPDETKGLRDIRMSFRWFFVRIIWGREQRDAERG